MLLIILYYLLEECGYNHGKDVFILIYISKQPFFRDARKLIIKSWCRAFVDI